MCCAQGGDFTSFVERDIGIFKTACFGRWVKTIFSARGFKTASLTNFVSKTTCEN